MAAARECNIITVDAPFEDTLVLGQLAASLVSDDLQQSLDAAVETLRTAVGAADCEIFLREPGGGDLILAACCGPDRETLEDIVRFETGAGYPGRVAATGEPLLTRQLKRDRRFLRHRATERGVCSFVSIPLHGPDGCLGCIDCAWHESGAPIERSAELLSKAAKLLATTVRASLLASRELVEQAVNSVNPELESLALVCLDVLARRARARSGTMVLYDVDGSETRIFTTSRDGCICAEAVNGKRRCNPLAAGHAVALASARNDWPIRCMCLPRSVESPLCLPLRSRGRLHGTVVLDRGEAPSAMLGRDLVPLLVMASEATTRLVPPRPENPAMSARQDSTAPMLEVECLGGFDLRLNGLPVAPESFGRRKALTLLKLLIMQGGNPLSRDALSELIWPGVSAPTGANRLHGVLHALRAVIEPYREQRKWVFVCNLGDLYYFNMESPHWIDIFAFRRHAASAQEAERRGRRAEAIQHLEAALDLYRGDLFSDDPYATWCDLARLDLRHRQLDLSAKVADLLIAEGNPTRAVSRLRNGLLADPLREDLHQMLMQTLINLGRRPEAWAQYQTCVRVLNDELGVEPLPKTRQLGHLALPRLIPDGNASSDMPESA